MHKTLFISFDIKTVIKYSELFNDMSNSFGYVDYIFNVLSKAKDKKCTTLNVFNLGTLDDYYIEFGYVKTKIVNEKHIEKYLKLNKVIGDLSFINYLETLQEKGVDLYE